MPYPSPSPNPLPFPVHLPRLLVLTLTLSFTPRLKRLSSAAFFPCHRQGWLGVPGQSPKILKIMAKKTDTKSKPSAAPAAPAKPAAAPANAAAPVKPAAIAALAKTAKPARKPAAAKKKKPVAAPKAKAAAPRLAKLAAPYTRDDIALRAYFIAEKRQTHGLHGDEHQDWIEAERQLAAESKRPAKA